MATYKLQLNQDQIDFLSHLPEQGMGYQVVDLTLKNGEVLKKRIVMNCSLLQLDEKEQITVDDIDKIELHSE